MKAGFDGLTIDLGCRNGLTVIRLADRLKTSAFIGVESPGLSTRQGASLGGTIDLMSP